jgi:hypothetical protein
MHDANLKLHPVSKGPDPERYGPTRNSIADRNVNCSGEESDMTAIRMHVDWVPGGIDTKAIGNLAMT